jgi:hypothetical protein
MAMSRLDLSANVGQDLYTDTVPCLHGAHGCLHALVPHANWAVLCANFRQNASRIRRAAVYRQRHGLCGGLAGHARHSFAIDAL